MNKSNEGVTFYPAAQVVNLLTPERAAFFEHFGYDISWLKSRMAQKKVQAFTQPKPSRSTCVIAGPPECPVSFPVASR